MWRSKHESSAFTGEERRGIRGSNVESCGRRKWLRSRSFQSPIEVLAGGLLFQSTAACVSLTNMSSKFIISWYRVSNVTGMLFGLLVNYS